MATNRLEVLKNLVAQNPADAFARYGLAMEHVKSGDLEQAVAEFRTVLLNNPSYTYAYFHGGQTLEKLGRTEDAHQMYQEGIETASRIGDQKALSELQAAMDMLPL